jgi:[pyruvate, water dikinase]-phosphate phosphotransferase / [pyruvate, water dikinase] kinase
MAQTRTTGGTRKAPAKNKKAASRKPSRPTYSLHIVSDATGSLASHLINTILTQFPDLDFKKNYHTFQDNPSKVAKTIKTFGKRHHIVLHSLVDPDSKTAIRNACVKLRIPHFDLTGSLVQFLSDHTGVLPANELSRLHEVHSGYFKRVEAMEFTANHDDGMGLETLHEADVVLVGSSRVSKTPTSIYMGTQGYKVANVSITPQTGFPPELSKVKAKVVALVVQPKALSEFRDQRLKSFGVDTTSYADMKAVIEEVMWSMEQFRKRKYPVVETTGLTVEQIATRVLTLKKIKSRDQTYL